MTGNRTKPPKIPFDEASVVSAIEAMLSDFDVMFSGLAHHRSLTVAGCAFDLGANTPTYLDQAARALALRNKTRHTHCRIAIVSGLDGHCPAPFWSPSMFREREIEAILSNTPYHLHYFVDLNFWQIFDVDRGIGLQWMVNEEGYPAWDTGSPLRNFLQWSLGSKDSSLLHGGTLAVAGKGALLAGEGGAGKSSTVLAGIFAGLQSIGDDYVLVDAASMTARPVFDTLKQDEGGLRRLGQWDHSAIPRQANWQNKHQFYMPDITEDDLVSSIRLGAILLPELTHGARTDVSPVDAKSAFLALAPSGVSQIHCDRARLFSVAAKVARTLPAYRLNLGTQPDEIVGVLRNFLEGL